MALALPVPPMSKVMSFVFYLPDHEVSDEEEQRNATVLYDRDLKPVYGARFRRNSVCILRLISASSAENGSSM